MIKINKITLKNLEGVIVPKPELKFIVGGCEYDGGELPEVEITCGQNGGACWRCIQYFSGEYTMTCMESTGNQRDFCHADSKC